LDQDEGPVVGSCKYSNKRHGISWLNEWLLAFEEGFCSTELVNENFYYMTAGFIFGTKSYTTHYLKANLYM